MSNPSRAVEYFRQRNSALIVRVPSAEPAVGPWRARFDPSAVLGVPAHVTILFPFVALEEIDDAVKAAVRETVGQVQRFEVVFYRLERRPDVVWLLPEPDDRFRQLTAEVWSRFPQHPPYEGRFDGVIPHLTIADHDLDALPTGFETAISRSLPICHLTSEVELIGFSGLRWESVAGFPLARPEE
jgi:2'-5' RNA ligase